MKGTTIKRLAIKLMIFAKKAAPYVLATASAAGTVAVTVEAVKEIRKNTPKVYYAKPDDVIDDLEKKDEEGTIVCIANNDIDIWKRKIVAGVKTYWKPITFCAGSLACLAGSTFIFSKRQKQLIIATYQMQQLLQKYTEAATATAGVGGTAVLNKITSENVPEELLDKTVDDDGCELFYDPCFGSNGYYFRTSLAAFEAACKDTMHCFYANGCDTVENFYIRMGVAPPVDDKGDAYVGWGWVNDEEFVHDWCEYSYDIYIGCSAVMATDDGLECRLVCYDKPPKFYMSMLLSDLSIYLKRYY